MRVWVSGATGFVGGAVVRRFSARGDQVVALARPRSAHRVDRTLADVALVDLPSVSALAALEPPDAIIHCAAQIDATSTARAVHVEGTLALSRCAPKARFIHLSTTDVFAVETSESELAESSPCGPRDAYGRTKLEGEERLLAERPDAVVLRPPGIYGPGSRGDGVRDMIDKIAGGRFFLIGDGMARRSWLFVETLVDAIEHALTIPPGVYLVDDGAPMPRRELAELIARALGKKPRLPRMPLSVARAIAGLSERVLRSPPLTLRGVRFRSEGFPLDTRKLRETGFHPRRTPTDAIDATVRAWYS